MPEPRALLRQLFDAAVASADPRRVLARFLPEKPRSGRCFVVGAGKASALMAQALEEAWPDVALSGCVVTRYGHAAPTRRIEVIEAAHPTPDDNSLRAARRMMEIARGLEPEDLALALISGGGSSLLASPAEGLTLADKQATNRLLLRSGLGITEMNAVRRRLSAIKGGGLARALAPARVVTLMISDVPGDDPLAIASGPTVYDPFAAADLSDLAAALGPDLPAAARALLMRPGAAQAPFASDLRMIATPQMALEAAAAAARAAGVRPVLLSDRIEGEAREAGKFMAALALSARDQGALAAAPCVLLSGGETTVTLPPQGGGKGGRNTEFLLSMAIALNGAARVYALAADTDGIDGVEHAAGAIIGPDTLARARRAGLDPAAMLKGHDSFSLFAATKDLVVTGPTMTNVNDFRAALVSEQKG